jgi:hypothetical protein
VASIVASANGRSVALQATATPGTVTGILLLGGTPRGPTELRVVGTTVEGDSTVVVVPIIHDGPPSLLVTNPVTGTVARPQIRLDADCTDDDPAGCTSVVARVTPGEMSGVFTTVASGTTGVHATVSLAPWDGDHELYVQFRATDSRGQVRTSLRRVYVEGSTALTEIASAGTQVLDVDLGRVLYADSAGSLYLRSGATETLIMAGADAGPAWLHPQGAIFGSNGRVYDWRNGALVDLGTLNSGLIVAGSWALWSNARNLYRRDLAAGTNLQLSSEANNHLNDITETGVVVYGTGPSSNGGGDFYDVYRFDGSTTTRLTADADNTSWNVFPVTDGTNVVYLSTTQNGSTVLQPGRIALWRDGTETLLSTATRSAEPGVDYDVNGGWVAYTDLDAGGILQVYTRAPDGTIRRATSSGTRSTLRGLLADGTVIFARAGDVYAIRAPYTGTPVRIANDWPGNYPPLLRVVDGDVLLFLGRTVFRASY